MGGHPKCVQLHTVGASCHASCARTHLHYLFPCIWHHLCFVMSCFICRNLTLILLKTDFHVRNCYFSPKRSISFALKKAFSGFLIGGNIKERKRKRQGRGTEEQPFSDKIPLIRFGETYSTWQVVI